jgi:transcriptional regulator GlxA family with amidase domain
MKQVDVASLRMLRRARDRIDRDYAEQIDIPALAAGAGYSREHFIRAFRTTYGETPGRYRTRRRVERACELLRSANLTVTEICHLPGHLQCPVRRAHRHVPHRVPEAGGRTRRPRAHPGLLRADVAGRPAGAGVRRTHHFPRSADARTGRTVAA